MTQPGSDKLPSRISILWLLLLGLFIAVLLPGMAVSLTLTGLIAVILTGMAALVMGFIATVTKRFLPMPYKIVIYAAVILGGAAAIILLRRQTLLHLNKSNTWIVFILPVAMAAGQILGWSKSANWIADFFALAGFSDSKSPAAHPALDHSNLWVVKSSKGGLVVFDQELQPGNASLYAYYYDLSTRRLNRVLRKDISKEFKEIALVEARLGSIQEYEDWKTSFGEDKLREAIANAEKTVKG